jgi:hypothetical protein
VIHWAAPKFVSRYGRGARPRRQVTREC